MTAFLKRESSTDSMNNVTSDFDIDQYINLDHTSESSSSSQSSKAFPLPSSNPITPATGFAQTVPSQQTFSGPSHRYEQYKQQTGLPSGALATTYVLNDVDNYQYPASQFNPSEAFAGMNTVEPSFVDFNAMPAQTPSTDVDMDFGAGGESSSFVNPSSMTVPNTISYAQNTVPGRVWPGMHQQAALAKQQAQQQAALAAQRQRSASMQSQRGSAGPEKETEEEVVEESISRLLNRMRNGSVASSASDEAQRGANGGPASRSKKDEEDMDEDERLLASEEGKKLTSKERRQLRNKVSARAFRSRRKEYIGQLEGELAGKSSEADELRQKNSELMAENKRLSDLTRLLLSSPAFSTFLNDISGTGAPSDAINNILSSSSSSQPPSGSMPPKDVNPNTHRQSTSHIGMTMIPEESGIDVETEDVQYNSGHRSFGVYGTHAQVYALPALPAAPSLDSIDFTLLNDKTASDEVERPASAAAKFEPTPLQRMPESAPLQPSRNASDEENLEDDEDLLDLTPVGPNTIPAADDLYAEPPSTIAVPKAEVPSAVQSKPSSFDLIVTPDKHEVALDVITKFNRDCCILDALVERVQSGVLRRE